MLNQQSWLFLYTFQQFFIITTLIFPVHAEIVTDGSLGTAQKLTGPDFVIEARLGQQVGTNLFHSFETFNLEAPEQAIFRGPCDD